MLQAFTLSGDALKKVVTYRKNPESAAEWCFTKKMLLHAVTTSTFNKVKGLQFVAPLCRGYHYYTTSFN